MDDRRARLGRTGAGELALRRKRQSTDSGAPVARRLADEEISRLGALVDVRREARATALGVGVLVERLADPRLGQRLDEELRLQAVSHETNVESAVRDEFE